MTTSVQRVTVRGRDHTAPAVAASRPGVVLMTATLVPPPQAVRRGDPAARLEDYAQALRFYLSMPRGIADRILFVDNSASDLSALVEVAEAAAHDKLVEFLSFEGNDHPASRGKAFGEFRLLDFAVAETSIAADEDLVWKTTGRLRFVNLAAVARATRPPYDILCDLHNVPLVGSGRWRGNRYMDLRVWAFRKRAYDAVVRGVWRSGEGPFDAASLYAVMRAARGRVQVIPRFPIQPELRGVSGSHLREYGVGGERFKNGLRAVTRRVAPWLWL